MIKIIPFVSTSINYNKFELVLNDIPKTTINFSKDVYIYQDHLFSDDLFLEKEQEFRLMVNFPTNFYRHIINGLPGKKISSLSGTFLFASQACSSNYSHFTLQCLGAILLARESGLLNTSIKIIRSNRYAKFQDELLKLFGIFNYDYIVLDPNILYKVENLFYCDSFFNYRLSKSFIKVYERAVKKIKFNNKNFKKNIYLSRISNTSNRVAVNETELINYLKKRNFEILDFDKMPVRDQIASILKAKIICAPHGASGANLIYKQKDNFKFIEIFSQNRLIDFHVGLLKEKNCEYSATVNKTVDKNHTIRYDDGPYIIDIDLIDRTMEQYNYKFSIRENANKDYFPEKALTTIIEYSNNVALNFFKTTNLYNDNIKSALPIINSISNLVVDPNLYYCFILRNFLLLNENDFISLLNKCVNDTNSVDLLNTILFFQIKNSNHSYTYKLLKKLKKFYNFELYIDSYNKYKEIFESISNKALVLENPKERLTSKYALMTFHNSFVTISEDNSKLIHKNQLDHKLIIEINNNNFFLFVPSINRYICKLDKDGNITYSSLPYKIECTYKNGYQLNIKQQNSYLSARNDGTFNFQPHNIEWETFILKKYSYHIIQ